MIERRLLDRRVHPQVRAQQTLSKFMWQTLCTVSSRGTTWGQTTACLCRQLREVLVCLARLLILLAKLAFLCRECIGMVECRRVAGSA